MSSNRSDDDGYSPKRPKVIVIDDDDDDDVVPIEDPDPYHIDVQSAAKIFQAIGHMFVPTEKFTDEAALATEIVTKLGAFLQQPAIIAALLPLTRIAASLGLPNPSPGATVTMLTQMSMAIKAAIKADSNSGIRTQLIFARDHIDRILGYLQLMYSRGAANGQKAGNLDVAMTLLGKAKALNDYLLPVKQAQAIGAQFDSFKQTSISTANIAAQYTPSVSFLEGNASNSTSAAVGADFAAVNEPIVVSGAPPAAPAKSSITTSNIAAKTPQPPQRKRKTGNPLQFVSASTPSTATPTVAAVGIGGGATTGQRAPSSSTSSSTTTSSASATVSVPVVPAGTPSKYPETLTHRTPPQGDKHDVIPIAASHNASRLAKGDDRRAVELGTGVSPHATNSTDTYGSFLSSIRTHGGADDFFASGNKATTEQALEDLLKPLKQPLPKQQGDAILALRNAIRDDDAQEAHNTGVKSLRENLGSYSFGGIHEGGIVSNIRKAAFLSNNLRYSTDATHYQEHRLAYGNLARSLAAPENVEQTLRAIPAEQREGVRAAIAHNEHLSLVLRSAKDLYERKDLVQAAPLKFQREAFTTDPKQFQAAAKQIVAQKPGAAPALYIASRNQEDAARDPTSTQKQVAASQSNEFLHQSLAAQSLSNGDASSAAEHALNALKASSTTTGLQNQVEAENFAKDVAETVDKKTHDLVVAALAALQGKHDNLTLQAQQLATKYHAVSKRNEELVEQVNKATNHNSKASNALAIRQVQEQQELANREKLQNAINHAYTQSATVVSGLLGLYPPKAKIVDYTKVADELGFSGYTDPEFAYGELLGKVLQSDDDAQQRFTFNTKLSDAISRHAAQSANSIFDFLDQAAQQKATLDAGRLALAADTEKHQNAVAQSNSDIHAARQDILQQRLELAQQKEKQDADIAQRENELKSQVTKFSNAKALQDTAFTNVKTAFDGLTTTHEKTKKDLEDLTTKYNELRDENAKLKAAPKEPSKVLGRSSDDEESDSESRAASPLPPAPNPAQTLIARMMDAFKSGDPVGPEPAEYNAEYAGQVIAHHTQVIENVKKAIAKNIESDPYKVLQPLQESQALLNGLQNLVQAKVDKHLVDIATKDAQIQQLQTQAQELFDRATTSEARYDAVVKSNNDAQAIVDHVTADLNAKHATQLTALTNQVTELKSQLDAAKKDLASRPTIESTQPLKDTIDNLTKELEKKQEKIDELLESDSNTQRIVRESDAAHKRQIKGIRQEYEKKLKAERELKESASTKAANQGAKALEAERKEAIAQQELADAQKRLQDEVASHGATKAQKDALQTQLDSEKEEKHAIFQAYQLQGVEHEKVKTSLAQQQQTVADLNTELTNQIAQNEALKNQVASTTQGIQEVRTQNEGLLSERASLEENLKHASQKLKQLTDNHAHANTMINTLTAEQEQIQSDLAANYEEIKDLRNQLGQAGSDNETLQRHIDDLTKKSQSLEAQNSKIEVQLNTLQAENAQLQEKVEVYKQKVINYQEQEQESQREIVQLQIAKNVTDREKEKAEAALKTKTQEYEAAAQEAATERAQREQLEIVNQQLRANYEAGEQQYHGLEASFQGLQSDFHQLQGEYHEFRDGEYRTAVLGSEAIQNQFAEATAQFNAEAEEANNKIMDLMQQINSGEFEIQTLAEKSKAVIAESKIMEEQLKRELQETVAEMEQLQYQKAQIEEYADNQAAYITQLQAEAQLARQAQQETAERLNVLEQISVGEGNSVALLQQEISRLKEALVAATTAPQDPHTTPEAIQSQANFYELSLKEMREAHANSRTLGSIESAEKHIESIKALLQQEGDDNVSNAALSAEAIRLVGRAIASLARAEATYVDDGDQSIVEQFKKAKRDLGEITGKTYAIGAKSGASLNLSADSKVKEQLEEADREVTVQAFNDAVQSIHLLESQIQNTTFDSSALLDSASIKQALAESANLVAKDLTQLRQIQFTQHQESQLLAIGESGTSSALVPFGTSRVPVGDASAPPVSAPQNVANIASIDAILKYDQKTAKVSNTPLGVLLDRKIAETLQYYQTHPIEASKLFGNELKVQSSLQLNAESFKSQIKAITAAIGIVRAAYQGIGALNADGTVGVFKDDATIAAATKYLTEQNFDVQKLTSATQTLDANIVSQHLREYNKATKDVHFQKEHKEAQIRYLTRLAASVVAAGKVKDAYENAQYQHDGAQLSSAVGSGLNTELSLEDKKKIDAFARKHQQETFQLHIQTPSSSADASPEAVLVKAQEEAKKDLHKYTFEDHDNLKLTAGLLETLTKFATPTTTANGASKVEAAQKLIEYTQNPEAKKKVLITQERYPQVKSVLNAAYTIASQDPDFHSYGAADASADSMYNVNAAVGLLANPNATAYA